MSITNSQGDCASINQLDLRETITYPLQQQTVAAASAASVQQLDQDTSNLLAKVEVS